MWAREVAWCVVLALGLEPACVRSAAFECASASECADAGVLGRCEPTGFCSFPDPTCPSDQRYGDHAGAGLGGTCVPVDDGTTGIADTGGQTSAPTATTSLESSEGTTPLSDGTESSGALTLTSATSSGETTTLDPAEGSSGSMGTGTSGDVEPPCPSFVDDFEDGMIDASWTLMHEDYVAEMDGELVFELTPEADAVYPGVLRPDQDLAAGEVRIHVGQRPMSAAERLYLAVAIDPQFGDVLYIMIEGELLTMQRENGARWTTYAEMPYDPEAHAWLQIRGADDLVHFEASGDGATFDTLASVEAPFALLQTTVVVAATNFALLDATAYVSVADFEICTGSSQSGW